MAAGRYNLTIDQGSDFELKLTVKDKDQGNLPRNLSTWKARASMRPTLESSTVHHFTGDNPAPNSAGEVTISMTAAQTKNIKAGIYHYDLEIYQEDEQNNDTAVERLVYGTASLRREVTR